MSNQKVSQTPKKVQKKYQSPYITTQQAADLLHTNIHSLYKKIKAKEIPASYICGKWLFDEAQIIRLVAKNANKVRRIRRNSHNKLSRSR